MVEQADKNKELYNHINTALQQEKEQKPISDEQKEAIMRRLNELAESSADFDPDNLDNIIAFASNYGHNNSAEAVLRKAQEQKAKIDQDNSSAEELKNSQKQPKESPNLSAQFRGDISVISLPSYNVYKHYTELKNQKNPNEIQQKEIADIEQQVEVILSNISPEYVVEENAVALQDYLAISNASELSKEAKKRNQELQKTVTEKLKEFDKNNKLEDIKNLSLEQLEKNENLWAEAAKKADVKPTMSSLSAIMASLPNNDKRHEILDTLQRTTIFGLSDKEPDENGSAVFQETLNNNAEEFKAMVNAEYLKQQALVEFCEKNQISPQNLNAILQNAENGIVLSDEEKELQQKFQKHLTEHLAKFPDFNGPYNNKQLLENSVVMAQTQLLNRTGIKQNRIARLIEAPSVSKRFSKWNNNFAQKHPKMHKAFSFVKTIGLNMAKTAAVSALFGPVGLAAYSAIKTTNTIRKSYKQYKEKEGGNFKDFIKHLSKKENRAQLLTLVGQVASTAISVGFTGAAVLDGGLAMQSGISGHLFNEVAGNAGEHITNVAEASQQVTSVGGAIKAGFGKIISSPRRAVSMMSSLGIGMVKGLSEYNNLRSARKEIKRILEQNGVKATDEIIQKIEKAASPEEFSATMREVAPNIDAMQANVLYKSAELARKSNPKTAFVAAVSGAAIGLTAAAATEYIHLGEHGNTAAEEGKNGENVGKSISSAAKDVETNKISAVQESWNNADSAAQRLDSFGIDAKNANEMLREMGVIKEGDNHFYRQHELAKLVDNAKLNNEQRSQIQEWANDHSARVHNLQVWQAEHAQHHNGGHSASDAGSHKLEPVSNSENTVSTENTEGQKQEALEPVSNSENTASTENTEGQKQEALEPVSNSENTASTENTEGQKQETTEEVVEKQKYHVQGRIDKLKGLKGEVEAENPIAAISAFNEANGVKIGKNANLTITDEYGNKTEYTANIGKQESTEVTYYEGDKEIGRTKTQFYKDGSSKTVTKTYIDNDGERDKVTTVRHADGSSVSYTKLSKTGDRVVEVKDSEGNVTGKLSANEKSAADGSSRSHARSVVLDNYRILSRQRTE